MTEPYPLDWPQDWPRTPRHRRKDGRFKTTLGRARTDLLAELNRFGARNIVMSTDVPTRRDGIFYASAREPNDPGVAIYFRWRGKPFQVACDTYNRLAQNVRAIHKTVEAWRTIERHAATQMLERVVSGFSALPPAGDEGTVPPPPPWWEVLGVGQIDGVNPVEIAGDPRHPMRSVVLKLAEGLWKQKVQEAHPDKGGSTAAMQSLNIAIEQARSALEGSS